VLEAEPGFFESLHAESTATTTSATARRRTTTATNRSRRW
jgi:hypothetical protein